MKSKWFFLYILATGAMIASFVACSLPEENNLVSPSVSFQAPETGIQYAYSLELDEADGSEIILSNEDEQFTIYPG